MQRRKTQSRFWAALVWTVVVAVGPSAIPAHAVIVTVSGAITQAVADGTGPAVANPSLNAVQDGQSFSIAIDLGGPWAGVGSYTLSGTAVSWQVTAASAVETGFAGATLLIEDSGLNARFTLLACLLSGDCSTGNALSAIFEVPFDLLTSDDAPAIGLDQPHPMLLLSDDGATDMQGHINRYAFANGPPVAVVAPGTATLTAMALLCAALFGSFAPPGSRSSSPASILPWSTRS